MRREQPFAQWERENGRRVAGLRHRFDVEHAGARDGALATRIAQDDPVAGCERQRGREPEADEVVVVAEHACPDAVLT